MELLKLVNEAASTRLKEDAAAGAVGAGSVAANATPLFASMVSRNATATKVEKPKKSKKKRGLGLKEAFDDLGAPGQTDPMAGTQKTPSTSSFDASGVVSKLKGLEAKEKQDHRDTVTFGLEDDNGGLVRVVVKSEQADEFEKALQAHLTPDDENEPLEIAEILFKLRDNFDIVDVQWPEVVEDEEEDVALSGDESMPGEDPMGEDPLGGDPMGDELGAPPPGEDQATSVLTQVIDMMKADADARKAEARAREAEAKAKEADAVVQQAMAKVKQEEQYLDMDSYNKAKKDEEREAKRLAQLAKWKHDMAKEQGMDDGEDDSFMPQQRAPEEEEYTLRRPAPVAKQQPRKASTVNTRVRPQDVANFILNRVK